MDAVRRWLFDDASWEQRSIRETTLAALIGMAVVAAFYFSRWLWRKFEDRRW